VAHYFARAAGMNDASVIRDKFGIVLHQERAIRIAMAMYQYMEETGLVPIISRACGEYVLNVIRNLSTTQHPRGPLPTRVSELELVTCSRARLGGR